MRISDWSSDVCSSDLGANKIGPNLWNVVGDHQGQGRDYKFSNAMAGLGGSWTYQALDEFLTSPKAYVPGTKMTFAGLKKAEDRPDLIAWLRKIGRATGRERVCTTELIRVVAR